MSEPLFEYSRTEDGRHTWKYVSAKGGVHIWAQEVKPELRGVLFDKFYGGIEVHWRKKPDWVSRDEPDHAHCWVLDAPCWHDGSSLQFDEQIAPVLKATDNLENATEIVRYICKDWHDEHFGEIDQ